MPVLPTPPIGMTVLGRPLTVVAVIEAYRHPDVGFGLVIDVRYVRTSRPWVDILDTL